MSENNQATTEEILQKLSYLTQDDMPAARWTVGGALRYDTSLQAVARFLSTFLGVRTIDTVMAEPACLWSLDWFVQRRPTAQDDYVAALEYYAHNGIGVTLVFDNPYLRQEDVEDAYGLHLVRELYKYDRVRFNAVSVASDALAARLRAELPKLPVHCHINRVVVEKGKRTPAFYNKLAEQYERVCLHPADAVKPSLFAGIAQPARFDVVMNDPCLRTCPVRREHLQLLAAMRREPYKVEAMIRRSELLERAGCHKVDAAALRQKVTNNLTRAEAHALYAAGFRSFIIQSQQFRNEATWLWDIFQCMFDAANPLLSNKVALIASSCLAEIRPLPVSPPTGMRAFSFTNYE